MRLLTCPAASSSAACWIRWQHVSPLGIFIFRHCRPEARGNVHLSAHHLGHARSDHFHRKLAPPNRATELGTSQPILPRRPSRPRPLPTVTSPRPPLYPPGLAEPHHSQDQILTLDARPTERHRYEPITPSQPHQPRLHGFRGLRRHLVHICIYPGPAPGEARHRRGTQYNSLTE